MSYSFNDIRSQNHNRLVANESSLLTSYFNSVIISGIFFFKEREWYDNILECKLLHSCCIRKLTFVLTSNVTLNIGNISLRQRMYGFLMVPRFWKLYKVFRKGNHVRGELTSIVKNLIRVIKPVSYIVKQRIWKGWLPRFKFGKRITFNDNCNGLLGRYQNKIIYVANLQVFNIVENIVSF